MYTDSSKILRHEVENIDTFVSNFGGCPQGLATGDAMNDQKSGSGLLKEIGWVFLKLGTTAFGGPAAHIAMMEDEVVRRRSWISRDDFLDMLGATNLIPGPNSTELAIHIGHRRGGLKGLVIAGCAFILPAALIVTACAWLYERYGTLPQAERLLYGVKPVIIAIVLQALLGLAKSALKSRLLMLMAVLAIVANLGGTNELVVLFASAFLPALWTFARRCGGLLVGGGIGLWGGRFLVNSEAIALAPSLGEGTLNAAVTLPSLSALLLFFLKVGSVLFGSGYVLLAFLQADLVERLHWLTSAQLLDAIAIGQITPGPVFTTATFIGYILAGSKGAALATIGIFFPAFVFVALSGPLIPRLRRSALASACLDGINVASLALMAVVTMRLAGSALVDLRSVAVLGVSAFLLAKGKVNSTWLVLAGGIIGVLL